MAADRCLVGRREDRLGQAIGDLQAHGQGDAADRAGVLIVLPAGADQVATHHGLDRQGLEFADQHSASFALGHLFRREPLRELQVRGMVRHQLRKAPHPEVGDRGQYRALAGNRLRKNHVEGRKPVAGDDQHVFVADRENVPHLAAVQARQRLDRGFVQGRHRVHGGFRERALNVGKLGGARNWRRQAE